MANPLKSLTFAPLPKLTATDPVVQRRSKLITRLQQQIQLADNPSYQITRQKWVRETYKRVQPWWRADAAGNVLMTIRYGARPIEFTKGMHAIVVGKREKLVSVIEQAIEAVQNGDFDGVLGQMSKAQLFRRRARRPPNHRRSTGKGQYRAALSNRARQKR